MKMTEKEALLTEILGERRRVMRWIEQDRGVVTCKDPAYIATAKTFLQEMPGVFPGMMDDGLRAIFVYRMAEQPQWLASADGIAIKDVIVDSTTGRPVKALWAIGLSVEALERGDEYTQFLFLHELCHVVISVEPVAHGLYFHTKLDRLITQYNQKTGATLKNDYFGLDESRKRNLEQIYRRKGNAYDKSISH